MIRVKLRILSEVYRCCFRSIGYGKSLSPNELYGCANYLVKRYADSQKRTRQLIFDRLTDYSLINHSKILPVSKPLLDVLKSTTGYEVENINRHIFLNDNFIPKDVAEGVCSLVYDAELQYIFSSPGERKMIIINPNENGGDFVSDVLGIALLAKLSLLKQRLKSHLERILDNVNLREAGCILSWLSPPGHELERIDTSSERGGAVRYWDAHCDKANNFEYDYSVLLYLNSDFEGGEFVFVDDEVDYVIEPKAGRVLVFSSSLENIHRVEKFEKVILTVGNLSASTFLMTVSPKIVVFDIFCRDWCRTIITFISLLIPTILLIFDDHSNFFYRQKLNIAQYTPEVLIYEPSCVAILSRAKTVRVTYRRSISSLDNSADLICPASRANFSQRFWKIRSLPKFKTFNMFDHMAQFGLDGGFLTHASQVVLLSSLSSKRLSRCW
eukprot:gene2312-4504_t